MLTLIKNAELYAPEPQGKQDILLAGNKVVALEKEIKLSSTLPVHVVDAEGMIAAPGLIDSLVHITGGGGEGGFATRTPEMQLTDATLGGVTTLVGCLGTDATTRALPNLLAKVNELNHLGLSVYCYTGSYQFPAKTLLDNVQDDILLLDRVIGVGEVAIADHRASHMSVEEMIRLASEARVGGMLAGKAGIVSVHLGDSPEGLSLLNQAVSESSIPASQFYPTHINRNQNLLDQGVAWAKRGGYIDFTTSTTEQILASGERSAADALAYCLALNVPVSQITLSSDGNASLPLFDENGVLIDLQVAQVGSLLQSIRDAVNDKQVPLEVALACATRNPANILHLEGKGEIALENDADLMLLDAETLALEHLWSQGKHMVEQGEAIVCGNFE
ncbi:beta-aspartyl-peptidase [Corallincola platygyrae]|uniref:Isoaspartyl dipeptidase n=1 Tax=Corallincola platygyrae TaxID=1193278 RepID=A0ABW4XNF1_9GAMM